MTEIRIVFPAAVRYAGLLGLLGLLALLFFPFPNGQAQADPPQAPIVQIRDRQKLLDEMEKELAKPDISDERLTQLRDDLNTLRSDTRNMADQARPEVRVLQDDLAALGPPPAGGAPPEAPNVVARRKSLNDHLAEAEGAIKEAELLITRADRMAAEVKALRRVRFTERVLTPGMSPLSPTVWRKAWPELSAALTAAYQGLLDLLSGDGITSGAWGMALAFGLGVLLVFPLRYWLTRRFGYVVLKAEPTYLQRLRTALFTGFVRALLPSTAVLAVYLSLASGGNLAEPSLAVARTALMALTAFFFVAAFSRAALAPFEPAWRLIAIRDVGAQAISRVVTGLALLFTVDRVLTELGTQFNASAELILLQKFFFGLLISSSLLALLRREIWATADQAVLDARWRRLRWFFAVLVAAIPLTALPGYVVLSRLLATQLVLTAGLYVTVVVLLRISAESIDHVLSDSSEIGAQVRTGLALSDDGADMLKFWATEITGLFILLAGVLALLIVWGAAGKDLAAWLHNAFFGFRIGKFSISVADVLLAVLLFAGLLAATRLFQKTLDARIFPKTRLDAGIRHSVRATIGYLGFIVASMLAVSTLGLDLSNLAIIAGALSVGIGFGLQNIVNNFVSGLILLIERPIKVGDLVAVGEHQGHVKKISVRATEITTFDRASVFIPNSSLISGNVVNRTYADRTGHVHLPVGVSYGADAKQVRELLLRVADSHPEVRRSPPPVVVFRGFGEGSLNFELSASVIDGDKALSVTSDLCFKLDEAFRREGIDMPAPRRDLRVTLDGEQLRSLLKAVERQGGDGEA
jgi:potassium efflux system protein